jgi:hypothetical protein
MKAESKHNNKQTDEGGTWWLHILKSKKRSTIEKLIVA